MRALHRSSGMFTMGNRATRGYEPEAEDMAWEMNHK